MTDRNTTHHTRDGSQHRPGRGLRRRAVKTVASIVIGAAGALGGQAAGVYDVGDDDDCVIQTEYPDTDDSEQEDGD